MIDTESNFFKLQTSRDRKEWLTHFVYQSVKNIIFLENESVDRLIDIDEQLSVIDSDIAKLKEAQRQIKEVRKRILDNHFNDVSDDFKRFIYWTFRGSSVKASEAKPVIMSCQSTCNECGETREFEIKITGWGDLDRKSTDKGQHYNIPPCACQREAIEARKKLSNEYKHRLIELATMPYKEYIQTPEWQEKRKRALKRAKYTCQLCNLNGRLNVHHRTYERRGNEDNSDLIVLCEDCHKKFHNITEVG